MFLSFHPVKALPKFFLAKRGKEYKGIGNLINTDLVEIIALCHFKFISNSYFPSQCHPVKALPKFVLVIRKKRMDELLILLILILLRL